MECIVGFLGLAVLVYPAYIWVDDMCFYLSRFEE